MRKTPIVLLCAALAAVLDAADWNAFRGPNGSGIPADDRGPTEAQLKAGPLWKVPVPAGLSTPILIRNRVFLTAWESDTRMVIALDAATGKTAWKAALPKVREEFAMKENGHATPSMASDGSNVFAVFHDVGLLSFTFEGKERWRVPLGPFHSPYGIASSLAVADGLVFLYTDMQDESLLRAYDTATGKLRWTAKQDTQTGGGYSTPVFYQPASGPKQVIVFGSKETVGYQAGTGERIWWARGLTAQAAASPIVHGNMLFVTSAKEPPIPWSVVAEFDLKKEGRIAIASMDTSKPVNKAWQSLFVSLDKSKGNGDGVLSKDEFDLGARELAAGGGLIALPLTGSGDVSKNAKWQYTKATPYMASPLLYRGVLYTVKGGGIVSAFNPADGTLHKQARLTGALGEYWASPVAANGLVFFVSNEGKISVVRSGAQWEPLATVDLGEPVFATPALAGARLYVRSEGQLYCFGPK
ncbi:MAG: PQQ-binding-like beta-propeller repeat protein [Bryobacterales bacterium]|nr:PQQ-binding-like beta-propeller repeat protein [Bryobacterales bacterium]